jgi:hypothetical protein
MIANQINFNNKIRVIIMKKSEKKSGTTRREAMKLIATGSARLS